MNAPKFQHPMSGPWTITSKLSDIIYTITNNSTNETTTAHIRNLQPYTERGANSETKTPPCKQVEIKPWPTNHVPDCTSDVPRSRESMTTSAAAHPLAIAPVRTESLETSRAELLSGTDDAGAKVITPAREGRQANPSRIYEDHNPVSGSTVDKTPPEPTNQNGMTSNQLSSALSLRNPKKTTGSIQTYPNYPIEQMRNDISDDSANPYLSISTRPPAPQVRRRTPSPKRQQKHVRFANNHIMPIVRIPQEYNNERSFIAKRMMLNEEPLYNLRVDNDSEGIWASGKTLRSLATTNSALNRYQRNQRNHHKF